MSESQPTPSRGSTYRFRQRVLAVAGSRRFREMEGERDTLAEQGIVAAIFERHFPPARDVHR